MRKLLPILLALIGTGAGVGAGVFLMPTTSADAPAEHADCPPPEKSANAEVAPKAPDVPIEGREYVKMNNQFVVPVVKDERVRSLIVASLSIEISSGFSETVYSREPKLRDVFLQVMFDHANIGGFEGMFTSGEQMRILRRALLDAARPVLGDIVFDVLVTEMARQDS